MNTPTPTGTAGKNRGSEDIRARHAGFFADVISVAGRAVKSIPREPEGVIPALIVPLFFFVVNIGSLQTITEAGAPASTSKPSNFPWPSSSP